MKMVKWMSNTTLRDRTPSVELRELLGIEDVSEVLHTGRHGV